LGKRWTLWGDLGVVYYGKDVQNALQSIFWDRKSFLPGTSSLSEVSDAATALTHRSGNPHRHVPIRFREAVDTGKHLLCPIPEEFVSGGGNVLGGNRPVLTIPSDPNPAFAYDLEENLSASLAFNADSLPICFIEGFDLFSRQPEPLRFSNDCADVVQRHMDEMSFRREEESDVH